MKTPVTDEYNAGACGLDGEELTQALADENAELRKRLLVQRARNRTQCFMLLALMLAWVGLLVAMVVTRA